MLRNSAQSISIASSGGEICSIVFGIKYCLQTQALSTLRNTARVAKISDEASEFDASLAFAPSCLQFIGDVRLNSSIWRQFNRSTAVKTSLCGGLLGTILSGHKLKLVSLPSSERNVFTIVFLACTVTLRLRLR